MDRSSADGRKTLTVVLLAPPYSGQWAVTALRIAQTALDQGHRVNLHATADGVYGFTTGQGIKGLPDLAGAVRDLVARGLAVDL